jgi:hypothetical protein
VKATPCASYDPAAGLRQRPDVYEAPTHLRRVLQPRPSSWGDSFPFVPDDDLVALRVIQHSPSALASPSVHTWASVGGYWYDGSQQPLSLVPDEDCVASLAGAKAASPSLGRPELAASHVVRGGPRETVYFDGKAVKAAIVTMGGLCPGLNDTIRSLVNGALTRSGIRQGVALC